MKGKIFPKVSATFKVGAVCLAFFIVGYQACLFVRHSAVLAVQANMDNPDTVFVYVTPKTVSLPEPPDTQIVRREGRHVPAARAEVRRSLKRVQSFAFDPNTVSADSLCLLGFSEKQAQAIVNYRQKGGRFHRPEDFARSYVVADSVYERLAPWIDIPKLDINRADSAAFDALPGIGGYYAARMVEFRSRLGGYSHTEQLMDIYRFSAERYEALKDLVTCSAPEPYPLWDLPEDELRKHPYIGRSAHGVVVYRQHNPRSRWTVEGLLEAGVVDAGQAERLGRCLISKP